MAAMSVGCGESAIRWRASPRRSSFFLTGKVVGQQAEMVRPDPLPPPAGGGGRWCGGGWKPARRAVLLERVERHAPRAAAVDVLGAQLAGAAALGVGPRDVHQHDLANSGGGGELGEEHREEAEAAAQVDDRRGLRGRAVLLQPREQRLEHGARLVELLEHARDAEGGALRNFGETLPHRGREAALPPPQYRDGRRGQHRVQPRAGQRRKHSRQASGAVLRQSGSPARRAHPQRELHA